MADLTVFYSWQNDRDVKSHRYFIRDAAKEAIKRIVRDGILDDSPRLDHDTENTSGSPAIADLIIQKIDKSAVFIADYTFVGETHLNDPNKEDRLLANPNVILELGYAAARIGWERMILVMNVFYGGPDKLPFDLQQHRRFPICYSLDPADKGAAKEAHKKLADDLATAIKVAVDAEYRLATDTIERLDVSSVLLCKEHGDRKAFFRPPFNNLNDRLARMDETHAITRLIDLGMIRADYDVGVTKYAYHWTYLGRMVLTRMGIRLATSPPPQPLTVTMAQAVAPGASGDVFTADVLPVFPNDTTKLLETQREEAKKELVRVSLGICTDVGFFADVYNSGDVPAYIREVALGRDLGPDKTMRTPLLVATPMPVADGSGSIRYAVLGQKSLDLPARKEARFVLPRVPSAIVQQMTSCPPEEIWLAVSTHGGEIYRVTGEEVQQVLAKGAMLWDAMEEAARPKTLEVVFYVRESENVLKEAGRVKVHLVKPGGKGPVEVGLKSISDFSVSDADAKSLAQELVNGKVIGQLGRYEWRVE